MPLRKPDLSSDPRVAVRWVRDHLPDVHLPDVQLPRLKTPNLRAPDVRLPEVRLPDVRSNGREAVAWIVDHFPQPQRRRGPEPSALILPAVLAAAGAGAAFWWWTQWSRGREETRLAEEGAAHPEHIMDHAPPPPPQGDAPNPSEDRLQAPAEEILAHVPPPAEAAPKRRLKKVSPIVAPVAEKALRDSLAVQASASRPKPRRPSAKPTP